ncbi:MAG: NUDIX hydrolase [Candidatus Gracilibacteria bacterium]|nr:NUDIX hydrolase [Candidatus Gracilibacteria bacterium]
MKVLETQIVHPGRFVDKVIVSVENDDGTTTPWEGVYRKGTGLVAGALVENIQEGFFLLVEQFRPHFNSRVLEIVAGLVDKGNTPLQTINLELLEEAGYTAKNITLILEGPKSAGMTNEYEYYYHVEITGKGGTQDLGKDEKTLEIVKVENKLSELLKLTNQKQSQGILVSPEIWNIIGKMTAMGAEFKK